MQLTVQTNCSRTDFWRLFFPSWL